jgi:hypothetical protein
MAMNERTRGAPLLGILICAAAALAGRADAQASGREKKLPDKQDIATESAAIERANRLTGLNQLTASAAARRIVISSSNLPFLAGEVVGQPAWQVDFGKTALRLKLALRGFQDSYQREFRVILLERGGQLVGVSSRYEGEDPDMREPPSAESAQRQLQGGSEVYTGLPADDPKIVFLDALNVVLTKGSGSPFLAKVIEGVYVMDSSRGSPARPVWAITLRGLPPFSAHGPGADSVPVWQRNHMRNVLDAMTGQLLFATNTPQPI